MDKKEVLKAKIDLHKTMFSASFGVAFASNIGYWTFYQKNQLAQTSFLITSILFAIATLIFLAII